MVLDANLKKLGYGAFQGKYTKIGDIILYVVKWYDNRAVTLDYFVTTLAHIVSLKLKGMTMVKRGLFKSM